MGEKAKDWQDQVSKPFEDWVEDNIEEISYMQGIAAEELPAELDNRTGSYAAGPTAPGQYRK